MLAQTLSQQILAKNSYLCVGLDTDISKIPSHLLKEKYPLFEFNRQIIDAVADSCVAFKPNIAFYESMGSKGWEELEMTMEYIPDNFFTIADAKRGDIGNTSALYAKAFFEQMNFDALTVAPYMGEDSVKPFLAYKDKWVILLALTSNTGSIDFQQLSTSDGQKIYEIVLQKSQTWGSTTNMMYVVGATQATHLAAIRQLVPHHFLLVPGYGTQGGDLASVSKFGLTKEVGLLVNSSRGIIFADNSKDFAKTAAKEAAKIAAEMKTYIATYL
jgi:orotidine-5'-phosphate decarboxylase